MIIFRREYYVCVCIRLLSRSAGCHVLGQPGSMSSGCVPHALSVVLMTL